MKKIFSNAGKLIFNARVETMKELVELALKNGVSLRYVNLYSADLSGADFSGADLSGVDLSKTNLSKAKITFNKNEITVKHFRFFRRLYDFDVWAVIDENNVEYVKMGCFERTRKEWEADFWNNPNYPNNGNFRSQKRLFAFETACKWLDMEKNF